MNTRHALALASASLLILGACSSQPKLRPASEVVPQVAEEDTTPAPTAGVTTEEVAPVAAAPKLGDRVFFDLDGDDLDADDQALLKQHALKYAQDPAVRILVAGNCDERGTREYNLALGERRAAAVKGYLVSLGIDAKRIDTISYGKERPIAAGSDEQAWAMNRNGFIQVVSQKMN